MHALLRRRLASGPRRPADELRPGADAFLRRLSPPFFNVPDEKFRVACHVFAEDEERVQELENFWLDVLRLSRSTLTKTQINRYSNWSKRKRVSVLPHGTCRITVHDTRLAHTLYGSIQELAGFTRGEWSRR